VPTKYHILRTCIVERSKVKVTRSMYVTLGRCTRMVSRQGHTDYRHGEQVNLAQKR